MPVLPPPPINDKPGSFAWLDWYKKLREYIATSGSVPWYIINFAGSNITDIVNRSHANLQGVQGGTAGEAYHVYQEDAEMFDHTGNLVINRDAGYGIKVDIDDPGYGWRDILGPIEIKTAGVTDPVWAVYQGTIYAYTFDTATAEAFFTFHIPHDYVPGTDLYIHMHWSQIVVDTGGPAGVPGTVEWNFDISYADGHGTAGGTADGFSAPITVTVTQQASTTQYGHMIAEGQISAAAGAGGLLNSDTIQVDGLLLVRVYRVKANAADTLDQAPFGHTCDIHYQSTNIGTKQKAPDFYN